jgi:hypothetical protein
MTTQITWNSVRWRALAHVRRDILLYAAEEPIRVSLIRGFVEDALGLEPRQSVDEANAIVVQLVSEGMLAPKGRESPGVANVGTVAAKDSEFAMTESGSAWVRAYYEHLEKIAGKRPAV